ncbi:hypothetical protein ACSVDA_11870 [Cytobacillus sp. Hm23]
MSNQAILNSTCKTCDYKKQCTKTFEYAGKVHVAKEQIFLRMKCKNVIQDICRDCQLFHEKKCAAWKVINGENINGKKLETCPKKIYTK